MNWTKALIAGVASGVALWLADFVMHGFIMGATYAKYPVFTQEAANPLHFLLVSVFITVFAAILFAKTRGSWGAGLKGGATYGFWLGMVSFFTTFYSPLVLEGFPYYLSWCQGGINLIGFVIVGVVLGLVYKG